MTRRITGLISITALSVFAMACDGTVNDNRMANANANATATATPTPIANANTDDTRRVPTRDEYERDRDRYEREARESGRTIGTGVNDGWLWVKTRFELAAADDLRDSTINVDVENGVVTLSGTVASAAQKTRAEQIVMNVEDVTNVRNNLRVVASNANS
jgi:hypothetical protein